MTSPKDGFRMISTPPLVKEERTLTLTLGAHGRLHVHGVGALSALVDISVPRATFGATELSSLVAQLTELSEALRTGRLAAPEQKRPGRPRTIDDIRAYRAQKAREYRARKKEAQNG